METPEHQEARGRQRVSLRGIAAAAFTAGLFTFFLSGGSPWSTAGTMNAIMGRDVRLGIFTIALSHFAVAFVYATVIAAVIYRLRVLSGIAVGVAVSLGLYLINYALFRGVNSNMQSPEFRALLVHVVFGLIASGVYKGASVPKPIRDANESRATSSR
jgi:hypothetical protein